MRQIEGGHDDDSPQTVTPLLLNVPPSNKLMKLCCFALSAEPNFVGSFDVGAYVYFFFRETAIEYINCGKAVYSRVARVCKKDIGGKTILVQNFATYLKARLNCSISGEFPFYFNEIQSVYQLPTDKTKFYATFTTSTNGLVGSAVCSYDLNDIQEAFAGTELTQSLAIYYGPIPGAIGPVRELMWMARVKLNLRSSQNSPFVRSSVCALCRQIQGAGDIQLGVAAGAQLEGAGTAAGQVRGGHDESAG